jgi:anti-sigma-K factor RskA
MRNLWIILGIMVAIVATVAILVYGVLFAAWLTGLPLGLIVLGLFGFIVLFVIAFMVADEYNLLK